ncbi:gliding motility-associated C-terminal domain-containing protein [Mucilaginibacter myungsuensis]|uniref:Gliding motility-associated C-terminal domain-containing protein n=1 Tax=Mucilaginibacter myungsuensis TaxID=649104 RepID=A0A929KUW2_9SPHI|nr:gliding motility-associated C-terminal domain-containing protein [Mucilaginibacter myungsuensis]MBE9660868.1 gliding motility-associated C-terminal domain-containing protein [Mucilaginibacter myungsuensis]MDN3600915.1 gliding motility-associated C-terminal domain-containing protein [Mucilaginibacter myungsuensis]
MKISTYLKWCIFTLTFWLFNSQNVFAQRNYATTQRTGTNGVCLLCAPTDPANAADGNTQTNSVVRVTVGLLAQSWQEVIFPGAGKVPANTPVTVKLGSGDNLLNLTLLGGTLLQAYNGNTAIGQPVTAASLLSALSNNNQALVTFTPNAIYDRVRVTLDAGLLGAASSIYLYDAFYNSPGNGACNTAIDELNGISSALLGLGLNVGGVVNPANAIDGNITTASTLNAGVGLLGASAQQTAIFQQPSVPGDSVKLIMSIPRTLLTAGVTENISVTTFNGNTSNGDTRTLSSALLSIRLLDFGPDRQQAIVTFAPTAVFDRVQVRLGGGIGSVLSSIDLFEVQRVIPSPVIKYNNVVANSVQLCTGGSATLVANSVPNTVFNWYTTATGGSPIFTGASFTTPALSSTIVYYVEAVRNGCTDASARTAVTVNVSAIPTAPVVINPAVTLCQGQTATFAVTPTAGITISWYATATGGTALATGNSFTTGPLSATTTYYAEATSGGGICVSPARTAVIATVSAPPLTPTLTAPAVTICSGDAAVLSVASPVAGQTYNWYSAATGGTLIFTGTTFTTSALTNNTNYYVEAVNTTGCTSTARAQATVTVQPKPTDPTLVANNQTISAGQTATITVSNNQTGVTYNWYTSAGAASPIFTGTTFITPALFTNTTYYVGAVNSTGCTSVNRTPITITVTINTNAPCSFANAQSNAVSGLLCVACNVTLPALAVDADTTTASTLHIVAGVVGTYIEQELRFQQPGFAGDNVKLGLQSPIGLADAGVLGSIQVTFYNGTTAGATYLLSNPLVKVNLLGTGDKYQVIVPATGAYDRVVVRLTSGLLSAVDALSIYYAIQQFAPPVFNPVAPEICKGSTATINITTPVNGGTYTWYTVPTGGTSVATGTTFTTPVLNANAVYYVEYTRNGCVSPVRYAINVLTNDVPLKPVAAFNSITINSGQTATLTATAANGATVRWYSSATGGTILGTGNNFTTPALTANATYYADAALGNCVSVDRTPINVVVNAVPDITVTPPTRTINAGTTTTFTASSTTPGTIFNWYTTPTGGTAIATGATFTTPPQFANNVYYAEAVVQATGTPSATRATGTITVNSIASSAVPCDAAIDQINTTSGLLCVGCSVANAAGAVDADRNTFSQLNVPIGLVGSYAQQTLRFAGIGRAGDSVVVELGTPGSLASVGLLSGISLATYNGATYNNDRFNVNGALLTVTLLNGDSRFRVAFRATADFDRVEIRQNGALAGVLASLNVYDAYQEVAAPTIATASVTACEGSQTTLTATVPSHVTVRWYTTPTGGTPVFTGTSFNTPVLTATTTYYAEASRTGNGCAQPVRTPATVTVVPVPTAPVVAVPNVTICSGSTASFAVTPVAGVTYTWYTAPTGGTSIFTGNSFTTPALASTASYYVEASNGTCGSTSRTQVTATVSGAVTVPVLAQSSVTTCAGSSATLTATSPQAGVTFRWYTAATGGSPVFTGAQFTTPALNANTNYYVEAVAGTCTSPTRAQATVTVNPTPAAPTVAVNPVGGQITSGQTATLTASSTTSGATFAWYTTSAGGTAVATGSVFTTPVLTSNTTYYVESALATGCTSARTPVTITVNPIFSTACDFASTQLTDVNGGVLCVGCSVNNPNNSIDNDQTNYTNLSIPVGLVGSYVAQRLIFSEAGAIGDSISIRLQFPSALASVSVLNNIRIGSYNGSTYNNDGILLNSNLLRVQLLTGNTVAIVRFAPQAAFDRVEVRLNGALASVLNSVDVGYASKQVEAPQLTTNNVSICSGNTATFTVSNARAGVIYQWYDAPTGGTLVFTGSTFTTPVLNATTTYYVQSVRSANSCPNPNRVAATVNVTPSPVVPTLAQSSVQLCAGDNVTLAVTNAGTNTVNWYTSATGGTPVFTGANFNVAPIANVIYYAELSNGTCTSPSRAVATIIVNPRPAKPGVVAANVSVCSGSPATLAVQNPEANVTYNWYTAATGGTSVFTGTTFTTPAITANTTYYVEAASNTGSCINNGGRTAVNVTTNGVIANATLSATNTSVCFGGSATISVVNPVSGITYNWYAAATGGVPVFTGTAFTVNNLTANASYYVEAVSAAGCTSATRTQTNITVQPLPTSPTVTAASGSLTVCAGGSATLNIVSPQPTLVYRWYNAATGGTLLFTGTQFNTPALTANTTYYIEAASAGNCNASARTTVTVTVTPLPTDPTLTTPTQTICSGSTATLSIASPVAGVTYRWYDSPAMTTVLFTGSTYTTAALTANKTYYVSATNAGGCSATNLATAQVNVTAPPPAPIIANGNTIQTCTGTQVTLSISNPQAGFTYNWYTAATGGTPVFTGANFTTGALTTNVTYYAEAVSATGCISTSRTSVAITINPTLPPPVVTANGSTTPTVCSGNTATLTATSSSANVIFNWYTVPTGGASVFTGPTFTTGTLSANTTYYVEAVSSVSGCSSSARTAITITVTAPPTTPVPTGATVTVCAGSPATLSVASPVAGITYNWYADAGRTTLLSTGAIYVTGAVNANTTFYVEATNGSCPSNLAPVQVNVNALPGAPTVANGSTVQTCSGSTVTLTIASPQAGFTYSWYTTATGGAAIATGTSYTTGVLTANATYYVQATNSTGCTSATRTQVTINVNNLPASPVVADASGSTTPTVCSGTSAVLTATSTTANVTFNWYDAATGGTLLFTGATYTTPTLSANRTFYVSATSNGSGCVSPTRTAVSVSVTAPPATPVPTATNVTVCAGSPATLGISAPVAGVSYRWYTDAARTNLVFTGPTYVTGPIAANTTFYVESASGSCSSPLVNVQVNVAPAPTTPVIAQGATTSTCAGSQVTLSVTSPQAGITYNWYNAAVGGVMVSTGTSFTTAALTSNVSYFVEAVNATGCTSPTRAGINITVNPLPVSPTVTATGGSTAPSICAGSSTTLTATSATPGVTFRWYTVPTGGTMVFTGAAYLVSPTVNTIYYVEAVSAAGCVSSTRTSIAVSVTTPPATPTVAANTVTVCSGSPATVAVASPLLGITYRWYSDAARTSLVFTGPSYTTGPITANTIFYVDATSGSCSSATAAGVQVNVNALPGTPTIANGATVQTCAGTTVTLTIAAPQAGLTYNWYTTATGGLPIAVGTSFTTPTLNATTTYYAAAVNATGCSSATRAAVVINVNPRPANPTITATGGSTSPNICAGTGTTLTAASTTANVTFNWYTAATGGTAIFTGANFPTGVLSANAMYYVEAVSNVSGCSSSSRTAISVTVSPVPTTPVPVAATVNACAGSPATLAVASPIAGVTYRWYSDAARTNLVFTGPSYITGPVTANATYYVEAANGSCSSPTAASVQVNVTAIPGAPTVAANTVNACVNTPAVLTVGNPQAGFTYNWYISATGGASIFAGTNFTTPAVTANVTYYVEAVNAGGCPSATRTAVNVVMSAPPTAPTVNAAAEICSGATATLTANNADPNITIRWYAAATGGTALGTGNSFTTPALTTNTTFYAEAANPAGCVSATRTPVAVVVRQPLATPVVTVSGVTVSSVVFQWNAVPGAASYEVSINGGSFFTPSSGANGVTHTVSGLPVNTNVIIVVRANGSIACQVPALSTAVTGRTTNPQGNSIFVPNAFTPNGDGNNDVLYVYGSNIRSLTFMVVNQYGEMMFRSTSQASGWDGTYRGAKQPVAVYMYSVEAVMNDGTTVKKNGSVTLLK